MVSTVAVNVTRRVVPSTVVLNAVIEPTLRFEDPLADSEVVGYPVFAYPERTESTGLPSRGVQKPPPVPKQKSEFYGLRDSLGELTSRYHRPDRRCNPHRHLLDGIAYHPPSGAVLLPP